jgi:tetratricopeptide (TPR) repeat protein
MMRKCFCPGFIVAFVIAMGLGVFPAAAQGCPPGINYLTNGSARANGGDLAGAIALYTCAIQSDRTNYEAYVGRMMAALDAEQFMLAVSDANAIKDYAPGLFTALLEDYNMRLGFDPNDLELRSLRGLLLWASAQDGRAIEDFNAILQRRADSAFAYLFRGSSSQYLGDRVSPSQDFAEATRLSPNNADVFAIIGSTYAQTGETQQALFYLNRAIELEPDNARTYYFRGVVFMEQADYQRAIGEFSQAIAIDPQYVDPYYDRGVTYVRQGNYAQAIADFSQAVALNGQFRFAYLARGVIYEQLGDVPAATADYMRYIELNRLNYVDGPPLQPGVTASLDMIDGRVFRLPLTASAGQAIAITASSLADQVDPLFVLLAPDGTTLLIGSDDAIIGQYTARIEGYVLPADGTYTLLVTHASGGYRGPVDVLFELR